MSGKMNQLSVLVISFTSPRWSDRSIDVDFLIKKYDGNVEIWFYLSNEIVLRSILSDLFPKFVFNHWLKSHACFIYLEIYF